MNRALVFLLLLSSAVLNPALATSELAASPLAGSQQTAAPLPEIEDVDLMLLNPKIAQFLLDRIRPGQTRRARLNSLVDSMFGEKNGLGIRYGNTETRTAIETFKAKSGNCLSFTVLFVAMARHLGLRAYFKEVAEVTSRDLLGETTVSNYHMFAEVELDNGVATVDFLPGTDKKYTKIQRISDQRALAHFYNNRGIEGLTAQQLDLSVAYLKKALATDPSFVPAWTNLGVAQRRRGDTVEAEAAYRGALGQDANDLTALSNLAALYLAQGRQREAAPLMARVDAHMQENPFHHYRLGLDALKMGDLEVALRYFKEAARRQPEDTRLHLAMADIYQRQGDGLKEMEALKRALRASHDADQREALQTRIAALTLP
jgi:Flp pilus assembly protein TadD